ncbi:hypothetical protein ABGB16_27885 [Micromonospora sp. B11E3]|uniref:hypothetical protein n=1 Tax=Micromonospora sp. B11E3 TaxID=3153562 RepID=UPI00325E07FF
MLDRASVDGGEREQPWLVRRGLVPRSRPQRILALATFVDMLGSGVFMVSAALFFTRVVGLPLAQVGLGMGVAAALCRTLWSCPACATGMRVSAPSFRAGVKARAGRAAKARAVP